MPRKDRTQRTAYERSYYARLSPEAKATLRSRHKERIKAAEDFVLLHKKTRPCACGESDPVCLDFHHARGGKDISISRAVKNGLSIETIKLEISKCVVVCSNCHRKLHAREFAARKRPQCPEVCVTTPSDIHQSPSPRDVGHVPHGVV